MVRRRPNACSCPRHVCTYLSPLWIQDDGLSDALKNISKNEKKIIFIWKEKKAQVNIGIYFTIQAFVTSFDLLWRYIKISLLFFPQFFRKKINIKRFRALVWLFTLHPTVLNHHHFAVYRWKTYQLSILVTNVGDNIKTTVASTSIFSNQQKPNTDCRYFLAWHDIEIVFLWVLFSLRLLQCLVDTFHIPFKILFQRRSNRKVIKWSTPYYIQAI